MLLAEIKEEVIQAGKLAAEYEMMLKTGNNGNQNQI